MPTLTFDLGETLSTYAGIPLSWQEHYHAALKHALDPLGLQAEPAALNAGAQALAGFNTRLHPREQEVSSQVIFGAVLAALDQDERLADALAHGFFAYFQRSCRPFPESAEVLQALQRRGQRVAVLTDVPYGMPRAWVMADLRSAGLEACVDILLTSVDSGFRKPRPEGYLLLAQALGIAPADLVYVGNEKKDVEGVNGVGGTSILIDRDGKAPDYGQKTTIRSLRELL